MADCRHLRWKGYTPDVDEAAARAAHAANRVPYICLITCQPWGVDGDVAAPETCRAGRACCEPARPGEAGKSRSSGGAAGRAL